MDNSSRGSGRLHNRQKATQNWAKNPEKRGHGFQVTMTTKSNRPRLCIPLTTMAPSKQIPLSVAALLLSLPLQVLLHLHAHLTPFAIISQIGCFLLKFHLLYPTYRVTLVAVHFVSVLVQITRPILGYHGNLKGRIPSLSAFWILSALLHLPILLFLWLNPDVYPLPMEQFFYFIDCASSSVELIIVTMLIRQLANRQMELFTKMMMAEEASRSRGGKNITNERN